MRGKSTYILSSDLQASREAGRQMGRQVGRKAARKAVRQASKYVGKRFDKWAVRLTAGRHKCKQLGRGR